MLCDGFCQRVGSRLPVFIQGGVQADENQMEPTNPNANTYSKTNTQTIFDTLVTLVEDTFVGHSCIQRNLFGNLCGTLLCTIVGHSCGTLLWDTLVGHCCATLLYVTLVGHSWAILWNTLAEHS